MIDELIPSAERGKATVQWGGSDYITDGFGGTDVTSAEYEMVSSHIYGARSSSGSGDMVVILRWKKSECRALDKFRSQPAEK